MALLKSLSAKESKKRKVIPDDSLDYSPLNDAALRPIGKRLWVVLENREFVTYHRYQLRHLTTFKGFVTDLGSVPRFARGYVESTECPFPFTLHDWLYRYHGYHISTNKDFPLLTATAEEVEGHPHTYTLIPVTRYEADNFLLQSLMATGTRKVKAYVIYFACRIGGWLPWMNSHNRKKSMPKYVERNLPNVYYRGSEI